ncbi:hypothetical protein F5X68DRAFT_141707, partial [Plectosphaerella plurivora]
LWPFLQEENFCRKASSPELHSLLQEDPGYAALYYAVLALGCQRTGGDTFNFGQGRAWELFTQVLSRAMDLIALRESFAVLQALTAMSVFAMSVSCAQVDHTLLAEATRVALVLRYHKSEIPGTDQAACQRNFWVLYHMEKQYSFQARRSSTIQDYDIGCPLPATPVSLFGEYDWFLASVRFSRLLSITYEGLFSTTAAVRPASAQLSLLANVRALLEKWRTSIPMDFRPLEPLKRSRLTDPRSKSAALATHCYYLHLLMILERLALHLGKDGIESSRCNKKSLLNAARTTIELTRFIDIEPYTPTFILVIMPLSALFVLFDFVIHNPSHHETQSNLVLLDVASGYFSSLQYASGGSIQGNLLSEFAQIAKQFVQKKTSPPEGSHLPLAASEATTTATCEAGADPPSVDHSASAEDGWNVEPHDSFGDMLSYPASDTEFCLFGFHPLDGFSFTPSFEEPSTS